MQAGGMSAPTVLREIAQVRAPRFDLSSYLIPAAVRPMVGDAARQRARVLADDADREIGHRVLAPDLLEDYICSG